MCLNNILDIKLETRFTKTLSCDTTNTENADCRNTEVALTHVREVHRVAKRAPVNVAFTRYNSLFVGLCYSRVASVEFLNLSIVTMCFEAATAVFRPTIGSYSSDFRVNAAASANFVSCRSPRNYFIGGYLSRV